MSNLSFAFELPERDDTIETAYKLGLASLFILVATFVFSHKTHDLPIINKRKWYEFGTEKAVKRFNTNATSLIKAGLEKTQTAFYLFADNKYRMILAPKYANIIRNDVRMSFRWWIFDELHGHLPGFEPFKELAYTSIIIDMLKTKMSHSLNELAEPLAEETSVAFKTILTDNEDWHTLKLKDTVATLIAQISGRAFLGHDFCREKAYREVMVAYSHQVIVAARELHTWPKPLRHIAVRILPSCKKLQRILQEARYHLEPIVAERHAIISASKNDGASTDTGLCALDWLEQVAKDRRYDPVAIQICLSFVGMDTTSDLLYHVISDLSKNKELVEALRHEIKTAFDGQPMNKQELQKLKLMDSAIKESQRLRPTGKVSMHRIAKESFTLAGDLHVPKGTYLGVSASHMMDSSVWPDGETYNGYRFYNMRQNPNEANSAQLVSPTPNHMGFGFGRMACPGRFFVANELKIILSYLVMRYDFDIKDDWKEHSGLYGYMFSPNSQIDLHIRRRSASESDGW